MENEIFEEVNIESVDQNVDGTLLDNTEQENESLDTYSQDELVSALLSLMNEQAAQEEDSSDVLDLQEEASPILVQSVDESVDYTDLLNSLDTRLENVETLLLDINTQPDISTPLNEYSLSNILLVCVFISSLFSIGYHFIKDNLMHF